jgi:hypothetical protein
MGGVRGTHGKHTKIRQNVGPETRRKKDSLKNIDVHKIIILKWALKRVWNDGDYGELLLTR